MAATPAGEASCPSDSSIAAAGPRSALPATIGLTATQVAVRAASCSRTAGTARIGAIEISGFDGAITIARASRSASVTPGAGRAVSAPSKRIEVTTSACRRRT